MVTSMAPRSADRSVRLIAALVIAGLASGCVVASSAPGSSQAGSSSAPAATGPDVSILASAKTSSSPGQGIVTWVDRPAAEYVDPTPRPYPTDARPCGAKDLKVSAGELGLAMGNTNLPVDFANASDSTCVLNGAPTIGGLRSDGTLVPLPISAGSYFGAPGPTANIAPGAVAALNISGADACLAADGGEHRIYPKLRIGLPAGGSVDIAVGGFDTICGVSVSGFGVPADAEPVANPSPSPLTAVIGAPATAVAGRNLAYTITLTNPTGTDVPLSPCPAYDEFVGSGSTTVWVATVLHYYLNCDVATTIPAGGSVTFEMRIAVPANQPGGMAKFGWDLQGGGGPGASAPLEVQAAGG
jgi:hypothetical protein